MFLRRAIRKLSSMIALSLVAATTSAQSGPGELDSTACIFINEIEERSVISNTRVALGMRDGRRLVLHLENSCPQLAFQERFSYRAQRGELCVGRDMLIARSGEPCRIVHIEPLGSDR